MIPLTTWYAHHGGAPIPHRAARPVSTLRLEWHVGGKRVSQHRSVTSALLHKPKGGELMIEIRGVLMPWSARGCA